MIPCPDLQALAVGMLGRSKPGIHRAESSPGKSHHRAWCLLPESTNRSGPVRNELGMNCNALLGDSITAKRVYSLLKSEIGAFLVALARRADKFCSSGDGVAVASPHKTNVFVLLKSLPTGGVELHDLLL